MSLKAIDAFSGAGGLSLGLSQAGFDIRLAFDTDQIAIATHRENIPGTAHVLDASTATPEEILDLAELQPGELDLLAGGPPCQGFSLQRRGAREDPRNLLVLRYLDWLTELQPRAFLLENVQAIRSIRGNHLIQAVEDHASELGYRTYAKILNAADYGMAQNRKRALLIGIREGGVFDWPNKETQTHTVRDAIGNLPSPPEDGTSHPLYSNHYRESRLSALNIERIKSVPEGGGRLDLPPHLQLACHQGNHRYLETYGRLSWNSPSGTITARFDSFTRGRFGHPEEHRSITLREGARLQGFPDSFKFRGNREQGARMIGNAVPPPLAMKLGDSIRRALT